MKRISSTKTRGGNALFIILVAVALFAALGFAVTQSSRGGVGGIGTEKAILDAAVDEQCNAYVERGENMLQVIGNCTVGQLSYELASGANPNPSAPPDKSCHLFDPSGAGLTPCGGYLGGTALSGSTVEVDPSPDLTAEGTLDWARWDGTSATPSDRKSGGGSLVGASVSGTTWSFCGGAGAASWSDGTPTASGSSGCGTWTDGTFTITVPGAATVRTLKLYLAGGWSGGQQGTLSAKWTGNATPDYTTSLDCPGGSCYWTHTFVFSHTLGTTLEITYTLNAGDGIGVKYATLQ